MHNSGDGTVHLKIRPIGFACLGLGHLCWGIEVQSWWCAGGRLVVEMTTVQYDGCSVEWVCVCVSNAHKNGALQQRAEHWHCTDWILIQEYTAPACVVYLHQLLFSVLMPELHVEDLLLQAAEDLHLWTLSFFSFLQLLQQSGQLREISLSITRSGSPLFI